MNTVQVNQQNFTGVSHICSDGTGVTCDGAANTFLTHKYDVQQTLTNSNLCLSPIPSEIGNNLSNVQDEHSGLATNSDFGTAISLSMGTMMRGVKDRRVPFPHFRKLFALQVGDTIPLTTVQDTFNVSPQSFVTQEYPPDPAQPTKIVKESVSQDVKYTTTWAIVLYVILMIVFIVLSIIFILRIKSSSPTT